MSRPGPRSRRARPFVALALAALTGMRAAGTLAQTPAPPQAPPAAAPAPPPAAPPPAPGGGWAAPYAPPEDQPRDAWGAPLPPGPRAPAPSPYAGLIYVELKSTNPGTRIDRFVEGVGQFPVCQTPCRRYLRTDEIYVIDGPDVKMTSRFQLPTDRNAVTLDVKAGSASRSSTGAVLIGLGVVLGYVGLFVLEANTVANAADGDQSHTNGQLIGVGIGVGGIALAISGLVMVSGARTTVVSSTGSVFTQGPPPAPRKRSWIALTPRGLEF